MLDYFLKDKPANGPSRWKFSIRKESWCGDLRAMTFLHKTNPSDVPAASSSGYAIRNLFWARQEIHRFVWDLRLALPKGGSHHVLGTGWTLGLCRAATR